MSHHKIIIMPTEEELYIYVRALEIKRRFYPFVDWQLALELVLDVTPLALIKITIQNMPGGLPTRGKSISMPEYEGRFGAGHDRRDVLLTVGHVAGDEMR
ncbi:unnamed protein product, partial [Iphiclides podalirius]